MVTEKGYQDNELLQKSRKTPSILNTAFQKENQNANMAMPLYLTDSIRIQTLLGFAVTKKKVPLVRIISLNPKERCTACRKTIADTFQELLEALCQLARLGPAVKEKCSKDASQLAENMVERLKEWPPVPRTNMTMVETYATHERW